ncbi:hypothetical protein R69746_08680 [Paraburkholderia aspalathi]|uniref:Uncharacterized protein n=1 Tax=Paraburkholderia nemoris TaxID=2793076 RepID=A0ABN7NF58_9BURK|nr:hypothetical protein R69776_08039 [Paraburkholderia nemoris]CAE6874554.1 hypothetical protein R69746_08680 [Paraburkholderia aspalathi]
MQVEELAPCVRSTSDFSDALLESGLVSAVVVAHQLALPAGKEGAGVLACTAVGEVVDHGAQLTEVRGRIRPQVRPVCLPFTWTKHLYRCLIRMQHTLLQEFLMQGIDQWLQLCAARADPRTQCRSRYCQTRPRKDLFLTIQGKVVSVFGNQHRGQQPRGRDALVDNVCGHWRLNQRFAVLAYPLATDMPLNREHARRVVQLLADVLTDAHALAATLAYGAIRLVVDLCARQLRWQ